MLEAHFLRRIARLPPRYADIALALWRDSRWVRFLLRQLRLDWWEDRVALSLDNATRGPYVVVASNAHFVTCLAPHMRPSTTRIVPGYQQRAIRARYEAQAIMLAP
jgi:hypothetical protein